MMYVHNRLLAMKGSLALQVFSFGAATRYEYEGIHVRPAHELESERGVFDVVIVHAPLKAHIRLLRDHTVPLVVYLHGHEALDRHKYYPRPYTWQWPERLAWLWKPLRDAVKLRRLRRFLLKHATDLHVITVSDWMRRQLASNLFARINPPIPLSVIPNAVNTVFEQREYDWNSQKRWDFVSIRPFDQPKYGVDIVVRCAERNPGLRFLLVGEGNYFRRVRRPANLEVREGFVEPAAIPDILDNARVALLPTRQDTQGVLACECAQYGIPVVSSELPVCREVLEGYPQVFLFANEDLPVRLPEVLGTIEPQPRRIKELFSVEHTVSEELRIIRELATRQAERRP